MRGHGKIAERMGQRAEGGADIGTVVDSRSVTRVHLSQFCFVLGMFEAVQHRRVLREKQCEDKQQVAERAGHIDERLFDESTRRVKQSRQRQLAPGTGSTAGSDAHQQGSLPACMPQVNLAPHLAQQASDGLSFVCIAR